MSLEISITKDGVTEGIQLSEESKARLEAVYGENLSAWLQAFLSEVSARVIKEENRATEVAKLAEAEAINSARGPLS